MSYAVKRYHDFSCGHRVVGHENKCQFLHGHNYRVHFTCSADDLDIVGRVIDFGVVKEKLCMWLEHSWDHKFLLWDKDPLLPLFDDSPDPLIRGSIVAVPFNPTAENMARYLVEVVGPTQLRGTGVKLIKVLIDETRKCSASYHV